MSGVKVRNCRIFLFKRFQMSRSRVEIGHRQAAPVSSWDPFILGSYVSQSPKFQKSFFPRVLSSQGPMGLCYVSITCHMNLANSHIVNALVDIQHRMWKYLNRSQREISFMSGLNLPSCHCYTPALLNCSAFLLSSVVVSPPFWFSLICISFLCLPTSLLISLSLPLRT